MADGRIELCPKADCGFRCCEFQQGNYIVLYPGELAAAEARQESLGHLRIIAEERGGARAVCEARHTEVCDGGYKPLDCRSYPYFPVLRDQEDSVGQWLLKGRKCPLVPDEIGDHARWVVEQWNQLLARSPEVAGWLRGVVLVGYDATRVRRTEAGHVAAP